MRFALGIGESHTHALLCATDLAHFDAKFDLQTLLDKRLVRLFGDLLIHRPQERRQGFKHGDLSAQAAPYRAHFQADDAAADQPEFFGHRTHTQGAVVRQDVHFVKRGARQRTRVRTCCDDDVFGDQQLIANGHFKPAVHGAHKRATAVEKADLVFFQQVRNAVVVLFDDQVLARQHLAHVNG